MPEGIRLSCLRSVDWRKDLAVAAATLEAFRAINRLAAGWLEWHLGFFAALVTRCWEHLARGPAAEGLAIRRARVVPAAATTGARLARVTAVATTYRLIFKASALVKFLFARCPNEGLSAVPAGNGNVREAHRIDLPCGLKYIVGAGSRVRSDVERKLPVESQCLGTESSLGPAESSLTG